MRTIQLLVMLLLCLNFAKVAEGQVLDKKVSLQYKNVTIEEVLKDISEKYSVNFSYSNNSIPLEKKITLTISGKSLSYALRIIFKDTDVSYEAIGSHIVLKKSIKKTPKPEGNLQNSLKPEATISKDSITALDKKKVESDKQKEQEEVYASKDTVVFFAEPKFAPIEVLDTLDKITLRKQYLAEKRKLRKQYYKKIDSLDRAGDQSSKGNLKSQFKKVSRKLKANINTLTDSLGTIHFLKKDTAQQSDTTLLINNGDKETDSSKYIYRPAQVTFVTPLGTNGLQSWKVVNNISLNILAGGAAGLDGFEFGGLLNIEKDYMKGAQFGGLGNIVGDRVTGLQFSGLFNINGGYTQGAQFGGFMNVVSDSVFGIQGTGFMNVVTKDCEGVQLAGFTNIVNGNMYGMQGSGFLNVARKEVTGGQVAGFMNLAADNVYGPQIAGFMNFTPDTLRGLQVAGFMNVAGDNVYGPQIAGFMNVTPDTLRGVQVAGFMNVANEVQGSQIGFFNIADSVTGVQIGFLSISRRGYRRLELWGSENLYGNIAFKTGTSKFYTIFAAGAQPKGSSLIWGFGYGLGGEISLSRKLILNLDLLSFNIHHDGFTWEELNLLNQFRPSLGVLLTKKISVFAGPVMNVMVSNHYNAETSSYGSPLVPEWSFFNSTYSKNTNVAMWIGFNAGIRF